MTEKKPSLRPAEEVLMEDMARSAKLRPEEHYALKLPSVMRAREYGFSDEEIEEIFDIKLKPKDKSPRE